MLTLLGLLLVMLAGSGAGPASAQETPPTTAAPAATAAPALPADPGQVSVVTLTGYLDPILADLVRNALNDAQKANAKGVIFQTDLEGAVISDDQLVELIGRMAASTVPVHVWVGPTGSKLVGGAAWLAVGAERVAMAPGTTIGDATPRPPLDLGRLPGARRADAIGNGTYDAEQAKAGGITSVDAPTLGDLYISLPGVQVREITQGDETRREPVTQAVFSQLSLVAGFLHSAASPAVAYLMITIGLALLIFELFTAGVGVAGAIGAGALLLGCFGLASLPTRPWAVALLLLSMVAFAIDVQTGVPRFWTAMGLVLYTVSSFTLYERVSMSWLTIGFGILAVALTFLSGMPSMVRTRFSTPTIGREWMIGEFGRAMTDISPDGVVQIQGAPWRAYTNRATPIEQLDRVRVIGIEGLVLEVEPEEGAAKDYRDRRSPEERRAEADAAAADSDPAVSDS